MLLADAALGIRRLRGLHVLSLRVHLVPFVILVVVPHPRHPMLQPFFVASLWRKVQPVVRSDELCPARERSSNTCERCCRPHRCRTRSCRAVPRSGISAFHSCSTLRLSPTPPSSSRPGSCN